MWKFVEDIVEKASEATWTVAKALGVLATAGLVLLFAKVGVDVAIEIFTKGVDAVNYVLALL